MKNKKVVTIGLMLITVSTLAYGSQISSVKNLLSLIVQTDTGNASKIPDYILYDQIFRMVSSLRKKAESGEFSNEKSAGLTKYFEERADLTTKEDQILQDTAFEFAQQVAPVDAQARTFIVQYRQAVANGAEKVQTPPAELVALQEQRNKLVIEYRDRLQTALGADAFDKFDKFVQNDFASKFHTAPLSSVDFSQPQ